MADEGFRERFLGVYGHVNVDWIIDASVDPPREEGPFFGGVAGNIAVGVARFGVPVHLASVVGHDFPDDYRKLLVDLEVDLDFLEVVGGVETSRCRLITHSDGRLEKDMFNGPYTDDIRLPEEFVRGLGYIHISTGFPHPCVWAAGIAFSAGCKMAFDPSADLVRYYDKAFLLSVLRYSDIVFFNEEELAVALRMLELERATDLLTLVDHAIITKGKAGSQLITRQEVFDIPSVEPEKVVDTTGAGDAYRSGFYTGIYKDHSFRESCIFGAITASRCVSKMGAQHGMERWDDMVAKFEELDI